MLTYSMWHEVLRLFPISGARYTIKINTLLILQYQRDVPDYSGYNTLRSSISSREKKLVPTIWRNYLCYDVSQTGTTKKNCYKHMRNRRQAWLNISGDKKQRPKALPSIKLHLAAKWSQASKIKHDSSAEQQTFTSNVWWHPGAAKTHVYTANPKTNIHSFSWKLLPSKDFKWGHPGFKEKFNEGPYKGRRRILLITVTGQKSSQNQNFVKKMRLGMTLRYVSPLIT